MSEGWRDTYAAELNDGSEPGGASTEGSWLCPSAGDRERMLDMDRRVAPFRRIALGLLVLTAVAQGPWFGWWTMVPILLAGGMFAAAARLTERVERPEYILFGAWVGSEVVIAMTAVLSGEMAYLLPWLAIPVITLSARFSLHGVLTGIGVALALMVGVAFGVDAQAVIDFPPLLLSPAAVAIAVGVLSLALMNSDVQHRDEAVIDPLTGMLNRKALEGRVAELEQQSAVSGEPVGVIIGDLDRFKEINDNLGHATGDIVLRDVAYTLRKQLRAFDLAYRLGGEEFVMLLPGAGMAEASALAERLRAAITGGTYGGGHAVTMSFGVGASERGSAFDYSRTFHEADAGLYEAKRGGRDRVSRITRLEPAPAPGAG